MTDELEVTSQFSSIADAPLHMENQYTNLAEAFLTHSVDLPDHNCPMPNSEAMMKALKSLQEKIRCLELARAETFHHLSEQRDIERNSTPSTCFDNDLQLSPSDSTSKQGLQRRLNKIDKRFSEQAVELNEMKRRLSEAEAKQKHSYDCGAKMEQQHKQLLQHQQKILQHNIMSTKVPSMRQRSSSKPKKVLHCMCGGVSFCRCKPIAGVHYRLNLKDVPFLLTASTSPSHSITANYQQVISSMKSHSPLLCGGAAASRSNYKASKVKFWKYKTELKSLLTALEEEFGQLSFEHQDLAQRVAGKHSDIQDCKQWEKQLKDLEDKMESKAEQIGIVSRQIQVKARKIAAKNHNCQELVSPRDANVKFLRNMRAIQKTLQQDDLSWD